MVRLGTARSGQVWKLRSGMLRCCMVTFGDVRPGAESMFRYGYVG